MKSLNHSCLSFCIVLALFAAGCSGSARNAEKSGLDEASTNAAPANEVSAECEEGTSRCVEVDGIGQISSCMEGKWGAPETCANNAVCITETACGECAPGMTRCLEEGSELARIFECSKGSWLETSKCETSKCDGNVCSTAASE